MLRTVDEFEQAPELQHELLNNIYQFLSFRSVGETKYLWKVSSRNQPHRRIFLNCVMDTSQIHIVYWLETLHWISLGVLFTSEIWNFIISCTWVCSGFLNFSALTAAAGDSRVQRDGAATVGWSVRQCGGEAQSDGVSWGRSFTGPGSRSGSGQSRVHQTSCRQCEGLSLHSDAVFGSPAAVTHGSAISVCFCLSPVLWKHDLRSVSAVRQRHASGQCRELGRLGMSAFTAPFSLYTEVWRDLVSLLFTFFFLLIIFNTGNLITHTQ